MKNQFEVTEEAYERAIALSLKRPRSPWSLNAVMYDKKRHSIVLIFPQGCGLSIPVHLITELSKATHRGIEKISLTPSGETLVVEEVDAHISTKGLIEDILKSLPRKILTSDFAALGGV